MPDTLSTAAAAAAIRLVDRVVIRGLQEVQREGQQYAVRLALVRSL